MIRLSMTAQEIKEREVYEAGFQLNLLDMEELIGGSALDDLRHEAGLDSIKYNEDFLFMQSYDEQIDLSNIYNDLPKGTTFIARCTAIANSPDYILCLLEIDQDNTFWKEIK